jgi:hypothetical protein
MADEWQLSFFLEWYDPQSDQLKPYILHYHADDTIEMVGPSRFSAACILWWVALA